MLCAGMLTWLVLEIWHRGALVKPERRGRCCAALVLALAPVLPARVVLHDHSVAQVLVGGGIGAVLGVIHYWLHLQGWMPSWCAEDPATVATTGPDGRNRVGDITSSSSSSLLGR